MAIIGHGGTLLRTMPCPIPSATGTGCAAPAGQRRPTARPGPMTVTAGDDCSWLVIDGETVGVVPRTTTNEIHRCKAYATTHPATPSALMARPALPCTLCILRLDRPRLPRPSPACWVPCSLPPGALTRR